MAGFVRQATSMRHAARCADGLPSGPASVAAVAAKLQRALPHLD
jgi:hypothetical protein